MILHSYPIITVSGLNSLTSDGVFVVSATVIGVVADEDWWFDFLCDAVPGRTAWRFKVRVAGIWE
ncbi:hypothetical protein A2U01_0023830, partial [Trifolium medium]|nr:hypothetical protein [Trifolium medium]